MTTPLQGQTRDGILSGRYQLGARIGAGGMGEVFAGHDQLLERRVAVKLLPPELQGDAVARERLRREALAAAALDHPFICKIYEVGETDGRVFIVMEYVEGETLHALTERSMLDTRQILEMTTEIAEALDEAHRRGIVHRDLKPANVMLTAQGHVKVMDFGLAKQIEPDTAHGSGAATMLTDSGTRSGTPAYMSPEQVLGSPLDPRSDIFSLGVLLHELATGRHPFVREAPAQTLAAILRDAPVAGSRDLESVPGLTAVVTRMLAKACAERPQTMGEVRAELEGLRERARASGSPGLVAERPGPATERTAFAGRETETTELRRLLDDMLTGHGGIALLGGEPGVGKTRLARELLREARQRGCLCLTGHCYEMEGAPPFVPFVEIMEQSVQLVPQAVRVAMAELAPEIASIVPNLRRAYADIGPMPEVPAEHRRRLVFSAVLEYLRRVSLKSPCVLLLDDLHWADEPTLQLVLHVAPHLATMRMLFVGTYRDVELDVKRPFAKTLEALVRQRLATRMALRRLDETAVRQMLTARGGSAPPSGLARAVFRETEGNPFFVEEVYQHLAEEGRLFDEAGQWKASLRSDTIEVPEGVRLVVGRRLERLGEKPTRVLLAAAVIGRTFPLDLLNAVIDVSEDEVLDALEDAERAQLIAIEPGRRSVRYGFVHELIRTTLVGRLSLPRRQRLHLRIADALEGLHAASLDEHASILAHHLYQAGAAADIQRTARALEAAGRRAVEAGAFEEALEILDNLHGLELTDDDPLVAEALELRASALSALGRPDEAVAAFDRALAIYSARRDDAGIGRSAIGAAFSLVWRGRFSESVIRLHNGLQALSPGADRERARLLASCAVPLSPSRLDETWAHIETALAIAERLADPELLGWVLFCQGVCHRGSSEFGPALDLFRRTLPLLRDVALWERCDRLAQWVVTGYYVGRIEEVESLLPELESCAVRAGHAGGLWIHDRVRSVIDLARTGDLHANLSSVEQALRNPSLPYLTQTSLGICRLYLGDRGGALDTFTDVVAKQPAEHFYTGMAEANLFAASELAGDAARARRSAPAVGPLLPVAGRRNVQGAFLALEAFIVGLMLRGDREECAALYPLTLEDIRTGLVLNTLSVGPVNPQLAAAIAADAAGLADQARGHFETALAQARDVPIRLVQPTVLYWYGRSVASQSEAPDRVRGRAMVETACTDFKTLGMMLHAELAERFLRAGS